MTVVIKAYRFDLPPPAFTESNYNKGHWPILHETNVDLKDYPLLHECLGCEMIISDRIYDGDNISFVAIYTNEDTGEHIFTSTQSVPDPGDSGYNYWNSYRIASWIGHCHWEVSGPMHIRINVLVRKGVMPIGAKSFLMTVTETVVEPPPPGDCPDFWEDPLGWTVCTITNGFSTFADWFGGVFWGFIKAITDWMNTFGANLAVFIRDPVTKIKDWMDGTWITIQDLGNQISTGISDWWQQGLIDVGIMITNAVSGVQNWIDESHANINAWWESVKTDWGTFWKDRIKGVEDWVNEFSTNVTNWYNSNIQPTIDAINTASDNARNWILGFPTLLSDWWEDRIIDIGIWIADAQSGLSGFLDGFTGTIGDWWTDRVIDIGIWLDDRNAEIQKWVNEGLPGWIEIMFEWAKPVISPILGIATILSKLLGILERTEPEDPVIIEYKEYFKEQTDRVKEVLGEP